VPATTCVNHRDVTLIRIIVIQYCECAATLYDYQYFAAEMTTMALERARRCTSCLLYRDARVSQTDKRQIWLTMCSLNRIVTIDFIFGLSY